MATYYIDFDGGNNASAGTSTGAAWKHCPGDANATGVAASTTPAAGDRIQFKPGVRYYGKIALKSSGNSGAQIVYDGSAAGWGSGSGKAIIDGTAALSFSVCTSEGTGVGQVENSNFASIYYASVGSSDLWDMLLLEGSNFLVHAGATERHDEAWNYGNVAEWEAVTTGLTTTTATSATLFSQADSGYWVGAVIGVHVTGNAVQWRTITSFDPGTDTVTFSALSSAPYQWGSYDNKYHFTVINGERQLTGPGQYAVDEANNLVYVWPTSNIANVRQAAQTYFFSTNGRSYVNISGFQMVGTYGTAYEAGRAITASTSTPTNGVIIENNDIANVSVGDASAAIYVLGAGTTECYVRNNTIERISGGRGVFTPGSNVTTSGNTFRWVMGTVWFSLSGSTYPAQNQSCLNNVLEDCSGVHSNDLSFYGLEAYPATGCVIAGNRSVRSRAWGGEFAVSFQHHRNVLVYNNVFDGDVIDEAPADSSSYSKYYNNTVSGYLRVYEANIHTTCEVKNNILTQGILNNTGEDWSDIVRADNAYVTLSYRQDSGYGWTLESGGITGATTANLFTNYDAGDLTLKAGAVAVDAGVDLSAEGIAADVLGVGRPQGAAWDIGAYEYATPAASTPNPLGNRGSIMLAMGAF